LKYKAISTHASLVAVGKKLISSGLNMLMLEVVGASEADNLETIRLFGEEVLPRLQAGTVEEREAS